MTKLDLSKLTREQRRKIERVTKPESIVLSSFRLDVADIERWQTAAARAGLKYRAWAERALDAAPKKILFATRAEGVPRKMTTWRFCATDLRRWRAEVERHRAAAPAADRAKVTFTAWVEAALRAAASREGDLL